MGTFSFGRGCKLRAKQDFSFFFWCAIDLRQELFNLVFRTGISNIWKWASDWTFIFIMWHSSMWLHCNSTQKSSRHPIFKATYNIFLQTNVQNKSFKSCIEVKCELKVEPFKNTWVPNNRNVSRVVKRNSAHSTTFSPSIVKWMASGHIYFRRTHSLFPVCFFNPRKRDSRKMLPSAPGSGRGVKGGQRWRSRTWAIGQDKGREGGSQIGEGRSTKRWQQVEAGGGRGVKTKGGKWMREWRRGEGASKGEECCKGPGRLGEIWKEMKGREQREGKKNKNK